MKNRYSKPSNASDFIVTTDDEKEDDPRWLKRLKHQYFHLILLILTALIYLIQTLRAYIPLPWQNRFHVLNALATKPITRVYTSDLRPSSVIESLLLRIAENWQAFWLCYILSFIPRRTLLGYLYRVPDVFNIWLLLLLMSAWVCQWISEVSQSTDITCACLLGNVMFLILVCRLVAVKLVKYEEQYRSLGLTLDWYILRYFVLNSLFLYTTSMIYCTVCAWIESLGLHWTPTPSLMLSLHQYTTLGLSIMLIFLCLYSLLDLWIYPVEFRSIWTPYLFLGYVFIAPPWRPLSSIETMTNLTHPINDYLLWTIFGLSFGMILIRCYRQMKSVRKKKTKTRINSNIEQICS